MDCDALLAALALGDALDAEGRAHLAACARCAGDARAAQAVGDALRAWAVGEPPSDLGTRLLAAAAPLLAAHRRRALRWAVGRAIGAALLPLPVIVVVDVLLIRAAHHLLDIFLPRGLGLYLVASWAGLLALLVACAYAAVPLLAERQARLQLETSHG
jgi:hypothetical protein